MLFVYKRLTENFLKSFLSKNYAHYLLTLLNTYPLWDSRGGGGNFSSMEIFSFGWAFGLSE